MRLTFFVTKFALFLGLNRKFKKIDILVFLGGGEYKRPFLIANAMLTIYEYV